MGEGSYEHGTASAEKPRWSWFNWLIMAFFVLLGPVMLVVAVVEAVEMMGATERVTATVTSVHESRISASSPVNYCPTLRWSHRGATFEREMPTCLEDAQAFVVGGEVPLRIDPHDSAIVFMDSFEATTGRLLMAFTLAAFGMLGLVVGLRRWWRISRAAGPSKPSSDS